MADGIHLEDYVGIANHLALYFTSLPTVNDLTAPYPHQVSNSQFMFRDITTVDILGALRKLKLSSSSGPDNLPCIVFRKCASSLSYPLLILYRMSLSSGHVPKMWKMANVMPLFKGGIHSKASNYRPISMTSVCSKTLERIIVSQLYDYLEQFPSV